MTIKLTFEIFCSTAVKVPNKSVLEYMYCTGQKVSMTEVGMKVLDPSGAVYKVIYYDEEVDYKEVLFERAKELGLDNAT